MSNIWFTSDPHFGHTNIAGPLISKWQKGYRIFESVNEMNVCITDTFNKYVKKDDIAYILGDFSFGNDKTPLYRSFLNCETIHFITGNHDRKINKYKDSFSSINRELITEIDGQIFYLSHYSKRPDWPHKADGSIHLYGHHHDNLPGFDRSMDVGIDTAYRLFGEWRPFHIDEIKKMLK